MPGLIMQISKIREKPIAAPEDIVLVEGIMRKRGICAQDYVHVLNGMLLNIPQKGIALELSSPYGLAINAYHTSGGIGIRQENEFPFLASITLVHSRRHNQSLFDDMLRHTANSISQMHDGSGMKLRISGITLAWVLRDYVLSLDQKGSISRGLMREIEKPGIARTYTRTSRMLHDGVLLSHLIRCKDTIIVKGRRRGVSVAAV